MLPVLFMGLYIFVSIHNFNATGLTQSTSVTLGSGSPSDGGSSLIANETLASNLTSLSSNANDSLIQYLNHSSNAYKIQFQYPSDWEFKEKTNRFDEGTDISIRKISLDNTGLITVGYNTDLISGYGSEDFLTAFYQTYKDLISLDYSNEYRVIEQPSFINVDNQKVGTFLYTYKDKYEDNPITFANQIWMAYVGDAGYMLSFFSPTTSFDSPENMEIRDRFIKSIKFLSPNNASSISIPDRFAE